MLEFDPLHLIEEVKKRPGLYNSECLANREEKLALWKKIGAGMFSDWDTINKATAYDRVLQLQKKWRSLRDAYNREVRSRRCGVRVNKKTYRYYKQMAFLGGIDEPGSDGNSGGNSVKDENSESDKETLASISAPKKEKLYRIVRKQDRRRESSCDSNPAEEVQMSSYPTENTTLVVDSDKLFLLSFLPEMKNLPVDVKMWVRSQIAKVMQEAVSKQMNNKQTSMRLSEFKRPADDSSTE